MTGYMKKRLKAQGIEVEGHGKKRVLKFNGETISANDFISKFQNDTKFRDAYMKAKRGRVAGFFDNVAKKIYNKLGISRNLFKNFKQSGDSEADMKSFRDTAKSKFDGDTTDITTDHKEQETKPKPMLMVTKRPLLLKKQSTILALMVKLTIVLLKPTKKQKAMLVIWQEELPKLPMEYAHLCKLVA